MNIIESIKSGRRFRRISWQTNNWISQDLGHLHLRLTRDDIVADDWEVEQTVVTITREQFDQAWDENIPIGESYGETMRYLFAKALGF